MRKRDNEKSKMTRAVEEGQCITILDDAIAIRRIQTASLGHSSGLVLDGQGAGCVVERIIKYSCFFLVEESYSFDSICFFGIDIKDQKLAFPEDDISILIADTGNSP